MAGRFTREMYDNCAFRQDTRQSTDPMEYQLDVTKFVNCGNLCRPKSVKPNPVLNVDVESSLLGLDRINSKCDQARQPLCYPSCLLTNDPRLPQNNSHVDPTACSWGHLNERATVKTNMSLPNGPGFVVPRPILCDGNSYYLDRSKIPMLRA